MCSVRIVAPLAAMTALLGAGLLDGCMARGEDILGTPGQDAGAPLDASPDAAEDTSVEAPMDVSTDPLADLLLPFDVRTEPLPWDPDAACGAGAEQANVVQLPVDIIWLVDNSASMKPAIDEVTAGLNAFAAFIASQNLDYRVIMLSYRSATNPVIIAGGTRYAVCIPPPLAGDSDCGNGTRFFQSSIDVRSTQPLEQFLGTLDQTSGYMVGEERGGEPWKQWLRPEATKTIVVLTDDNSRLTSSQFESYPGGKNPYNSLQLPPGILDANRAGMFSGYVFHAVYGWGSDTDPGLTCVYPDSSVPPSSGPTYTDLVQKTGGTRAKICDGAAAWQPFFDAVAQAVVTTSKLSCAVPIPNDDGGPIDPNRVNVRVVGDPETRQLYRVDGAAACGPEGGWYYDDINNPTMVILCPSSCDFAQSQVGAGKSGRIEVLFGCDTWVR